DRDVGDSPYLATTSIFRTPSSAPALPNSAEKFIDGLPIPAIAFCTDTWKANESLITPTSVQKTSCSKVSGCDAEKRLAAAAISSHGDEMNCSPNAVPAADGLVAVLRSIGSNDSARPGDSATIPLVRLAAPKRNSIAPPCSSVACAVIVCG